MASINAFVRTSSKKEKKVNVRFRLRDGRLVQLHHVSELLVYPSEFDAKRQTIKARVTYNSDERVKFNKAVADRKDLILRIYNAQPNKNTLTSDWLESAISIELNGDIGDQNTSQATLLEYVSAFINKSPNRIDPKTGRHLSKNIVQQYKATEKHLRLFAKTLGKHDFLIEEINSTFYKKFVSYLQREIPQTDEQGNHIFDDNNNPVYIKKEFTQNTVGKHIRILKLMLNEGDFNEINTSSFKVFNEEVDSIYLNEDELKSIKEVNLTEHPHLDRARDQFLILAWTGSRYSELGKIVSSDIKDGFITYRQQKTNNKVTIPLHPVVVEILDKYNHNIPPTISNQKFNKYIKEVGRLAGITTNQTDTKTIGGQLITNTIAKYELISSHTGRRSFCTNMYKRGLQTLMIMSISGHKTEKSFLKYIKVRQEEHAEMMKREWEEMYK